MTTVVEIDGFLETDGTREPFSARVSAPRITGKTREYSCSVHAPALFKKDKQIFGIDGAQAQELAVQFLKSMLEGRHLVGKDGKPIDVASLKPR
jgi:hypothetical protein